MTLRSFIYRYVHVGEIVIFKENGWQIGMTRIDNDDLYLYGLNPRLLDECEVVNFAYETRDWANVTVLVIDILPTTEATKHVNKRMVSY